MLINALRGHLAEYGIVTGLGVGGVAASLKALHEEQDRLAADVRCALHGIAAQLRALASEIDRLEAQFSIGTVTTKRAGDWQPSRVSVHYGFSYRGGSARRISVPIRPSVRRLAWSHAAFEQLGWQRAARRNNQAGRWLSSPAPGRQIDCCYANDAQESGSPTLDGGLARAQACEDRACGARQQDSTDCLGRDDAEGGLHRRRMRSPSLDNRVIGCVGAA